MFLPLQKNIRDLVTRFFISDNDKLPRLSVSAGGSPSSTIQDLPNKFIGDVSALIVTADASAVHGEFVKFVDIQHTPSVGRLS
jgi:hypothetical protein